MRQLLAFLVLSLSLASTPASAGQFIHVVGGTKDRPVPLNAYLARPLGEGPFPAIVLLHGCGGFHASMVSWADRLSRWGYVALAVDTYGARGMEENCNGMVSTDQAPDSYAALRHLSTLPFVRASHVAVMGFSQGGWGVLEAMESGGLERRQTQHFAAGIAFYPVCQYASGVTVAPVLVLIGEADDWTPAADCRAMAEGRTALGSPRAPADRSKLELVTYPGVHHAFDEIELGLVPGNGVTYMGHRVEYNEPAMRDSIRRVREFLKRTIATR